MKTLAEMTAEVVENNTRLGWYGDDTHAVATWHEAMFLLHSEVSEAGEAWRVWKVEDGTAGSAITPGGNPGAKPEGVGSEFADILIRLIDDAYLFGGYDLEQAAARAGQPGLRGTFLSNMDLMHSLVARLSDAGTGTLAFGTVEELFGAVLVLLRQLAEEYGIDLQAEYERKAAYNRTRPYRHGGKAL